MSENATTLAPNDVTGPAVDNYLVTFHREVMGSHRDRVFTSLTQVSTLQSTCQDKTTVTAARFPTT